MCKCGTSTTPAIALKAASPSGHLSNARRQGAAGSPYTGHGVGTSACTLCWLSSFSSRGLSTTSGSLLNWNSVFFWSSPGNVRGSQTCFGVAIGLPT